MTPRRTGSGLAWSRPCDWQLQVERETKPRSLFVSLEDAGGVEIYECRVTSQSESAEPLRAGERELVGLTLTDQEARWLRDALTEAMRARGEQ